ncbi:MAG TPA: sialidase family protein [Methylomirabilota bacterium]|nr:sialidase family protein [Methylomirabilota bacterium]
MVPRAILNGLGAVVILCASAGSAVSARAVPEFETALIFPLHPQHNHAPGIVECPNGDLLVSWYRGSGERKADDVAVYGARRPKGRKQWSEPFVMVDTPGFPDGNTALFLDARRRLWLFWPIVLANTWESCITSYRVAERCDGSGAPRWSWQGIILLKPEGFADDLRQALDGRLRSTAAPAALTNRFAELQEALTNKLAQRLGWQPRCKPTVLRSGRIVLPLYSDTFSVSIMALSDDGGATWFASRALAGLGNIQPAVLQRADGSLVAYMRENGPLDRIRVAESRDEGMTWSAVGVADLPNPGSGLDAVRLANGHWALIYNDTVTGRHSLAVSLSDDEGRTWRWTRHLENQPGGQFHYPAIIQGRDGRLHAVYSYFVEGGKSMKHAAFTEAWIKAGALREPAPAAGR